MAYVAAGAAAAIQSQQAEEEYMTPYSPPDLKENWEFKIMRSATGRFRDPAFLKQILEEESRAGWMMLEKFDNQRVRLKRPASARAQDAGLAVDPYRVAVGPGGAALVGVILAAILGIVVLVIGAMVLFVGPTHGR